MAEEAGFRIQEIQPTVFSPRSTV